MQKTGQCGNCGKIWPIALLDGKPARFAGKPATWDMILNASDRGEDFDVLECRDCYGPAFVAQPVKGQPNAACA